MLNILTVLPVVVLLFAALLVVLVVVVASVAEATKIAAKQCEISVAWLRFHNLRNENEQAEKKHRFKVKKYRFIIVVPLNLKLGQAREKERSPPAKNKRSLILEMSEGVCKKRQAFI